MLEIIACVLSVVLSITSVKLLTNDFVGRSIIVMVVSTVFWAITATVANYNGSGAVFLISSMNVIVFGMNSVSAYLLLYKK